MVDYDSLASPYPPPYIPDQSTCNEEVLCLAISSAKALSSFRDPDKLKKVSARIIPYDQAGRVAELERQLADSRAELADMALERDRLLLEKSESSGRGPVTPQGKTLPASWNPVSYYETCDSHLTGNTFRFYCYCRLAGGSKGHFRMGRSLIAKHFDVGEATITSWTKELIAKGYIHKRATGRTADFYIITADQIYGDRLSSLTGVTGDPAKGRGDLVKLRSLDRVPVPYKAGATGECAELPDLGDNEA